MAVLAGMLRIVAFPTVLPFGWQVPLGYVLRPRD